MAVGNACPGLKNAALYLIRPDGYVALADPKAEPERLRQYFVERGSLGELSGSFKQ
jgi:hypothetical protein